MNYYKLGSRFYKLGKRLNYEVGSKIDQPDILGKNIALKFDIGEVKSKKHGEAEVKGHFLLMNRYGEFPQIDLEHIKKNTNHWISAVGSNWVGEVQLEDCYKVSEKCNIPGMVVYTAPNVAQKDLKLLFLLLAAQFILDDVLCEVKHLLKDNPASHLKITKEVVDAIVVIIGEGGKKDITESQYAKLDPLFKTCCICVAENVKQLSAEVDAHYYLQALVNYVRANKWEEEDPHNSNRYDNIPYTIDDFLFLRTFSAGITPSIEAIALARGITLPAYIRTHPYFQRYYLLASLLPGLHNDVLSLKKEIPEDEKMNFVLLKCRKYSFQESINEVIKNVNLRAIDIKKAESKLTSYFPNNPELKKFVRSVGYIIDGLLYHHCITPRYGGIKFECHLVEHEHDIFFEPPPFKDVGSMKEAVY